jgi:hypothetical protein
MLLRERRSNPTLFCTPQYLCKYVRRQIIIYCYNLLLQKLRHQSEGMCSSPNNVHRAQKPVRLGHWWICFPSGRGESASGTEASRDVSQVGCTVFLSLDGMYCQVSQSISCSISICSDFLSFYIIIKVWKPYTPPPPPTEDYNISPSRETAHFTTHEPVLA